MGRRRKNVLNKYKKCSSRYCGNKVSRVGTDNYCDECRQAINYRNWLKRKGLFGGNYIYVYFSHKGALYVGLTHNYVERHKQHLKSDKVFIEEDLWQYREVYEFSDKLNRVELEYLEYVLIQLHKSKSPFLTNDKKMTKMDYEHIPLERKSELKGMIKMVVPKHYVANINTNYSKRKMDNVDINYLKKCKKKSSSLATEDLELLS